MFQGQPPPPGGNSQKERVRKTDCWAGLEWPQGLSQELGAAAAFPVGCLRVACPGTPGTGDIVPALFSSGPAGHCHRGPSSPWPERPLYFSHSMALRKDIKDQRDVLFALFGV